MEGHAWSWKSKSVFPASFSWHLCNVLTLLPCPLEKKVGFGNADFVVLFWHVWWMLNTKKPKGAKLFSHHTCSSEIKVRILFQIECTLIRFASLYHKRLFNQSIALHLHGETDPPNDAKPLKCIYFIQACNAPWTCSVEVSTFIKQERQKKPQSREQSNKQNFEQILFVYL